MKHLLLSSVLMLASSAAFASEKTDVATAFQHSEWVGQKVELARQENLTIAKQADVALLGSSCGIAGCTARYLVTLAVSRTGVNAQTTTIAAIVSTGTLGTQVEPANLTGLRL